MWRAIEAAWAGASAPRIARVGAAVATAAALATAIGVATRLGEARTQDERAAHASTPPVKATEAPQPTAASDAR
jgi:hypothetical protein